MTLVDIILSILIITLFCLGFRTIISDGQILHFIRKPFEFEDSKMMNFLKEKLRRRVLISTDNAYDIKKKYERISSKISWLLKPFILCVVCFSSIWGTTIFVTLNGFQWEEMIICCISSAFLLKFVNDKMDW